MDFPGPARRGALRPGATAGVGSLFPFGFLKKTLGGRLRHEVVVWPAPVEYRRRGAWQPARRAAGRRTRGACVLGGSADLAGAAPLRSGRFAPADSLEGERARWAGAAGGAAVCRGERGGLHAVAAHAGGDLDAAGAVRTAREFRGDAGGGSVPRGAKLLGAGGERRTAAGRARACATWRNSWTSSPWWSRVDGAKSKSGSPGRRTPEFYLTTSKPHHVRAGRGAGGGRFCRWRKNRSSLISTNSTG